MNNLKCISSVKLGFSKIPAPGYEFGNIDFGSQYEIL